MSHFPPPAARSRGKHGQPFDTTPILSQKRSLAGSQAHVFENGKVPKYNSSDRPPPLKLASPPPRIREDRAVRKHRLRKEVSASLHRMHFAGLPSPKKLQSVSQPVPDSQGSVPPAVPIHVPPPQRVQTSVPPTPAVRDCAAVTAVSLPASSSSVPENQLRLSSQAGMNNNLPDPTTSYPTPDAVAMRVRLYGPFPQSETVQQSAPGSMAVAEGVHHYVHTYPSSHSPSSLEAAPASGIPAVPARPTGTAQALLRTSQAPSVPSTQLTAVSNQDTAAVRPQEAILPNAQHTLLPPELNPQQAALVWNKLEDAQRANVLQEYDYVVAEVNLQAAQSGVTLPGFERQALLPVNPTLPVCNSQRPPSTTQRDSLSITNSKVLIRRNSTVDADSQCGGVRPANSASDPNTSALQLSWAPAQASAPGVTCSWTLSTVSSNDEVGLHFLETIVQPSEPSPEDTTKPSMQRAASKSDDDDCELTGFTENLHEATNSPTTTPVDKGKQRATDTFSDIHVSRHNSWTSVPSQHSSEGRNDPGDQSGQLNSHIVLLLLRQIQSLQGSVREQADMIRDSIENSSRFQAELIAQLQQLKSSLGASAQAPNSSSSPDSPSASDVVAKTTSTRVSDMKVDRRVAQALGRIIPPTAEEEENRIRNLLVDRVHRHVLALLRCNDTSNLAERFPPLGDDNVASYKNGDGKIVCSPMNFRVDFHHPWKSFEFNVEARVILIETFLAKARGGAFAADPIPSRLLTKEVISRLIDQYIITLRRAYRAQVKPPSKEQADKAKRLAARTSRQGTLYRNRRFVVIRFSSLSRHRILFDRLSANNMSGDETDGEKVEHAPVYRIILAEWQSDDLRAFLWALDAMYIKYWEKPPESRRTKGNAPRTRVLRGDSRTVPGTAPMGLWRNCYNAAWLAKKKEWEVEALQIIDEDYDFTLPAH
ncbi:hypothetical protein NUW54_g3733 [Trametes sanguinea]|uniref:Uncharacterized protein n=1 Tax=Trametes sanguinea TaxID=158606 RepID=A0ACC1Q1U6_9APHY|nr:hypothetical protein NUW54_g3733 [Trametes sanguinea]